MTEKEIAERADSEMSDQALQEEEGRPEYASMAPQVVQEEDQSEPEESEQTNQPAEELDATEEEPEEASDFLLKWRIESHIKATAVVRFQDLTLRKTIAVVGNDVIDIKGSR